MSSKDLKLNLAIIGGGSGGYIAARRAAQLGMRVGVVESRHLGGVCLNRGCVPTKTMMQAVKIVGHVKQAAAYGVVVPGEPTVDYEALLRKREEAVQRLRGGLADLLQLAGIPVIAGYASFLGPHRLAIGPPDPELATTSAGQLQWASAGPGADIVDADYIMIATGSKSASLPPGCSTHPRVIDSDGALALKSVPSSMVVVGAGPIGCEWSHIFAGLGCRVTLVTRRPHVLPQEDSEVGEVLAEALKARGVTIRTGTSLVSVVGTEDNVKVELDGEGEGTVTAEYVLVSTGRLPLTDGLNLESVGVKTEGPGWVKVDDYLRTNVPSILAIGDVTGRRLFAHVAFRHAVVAVEKLAGLSPRPARNDRIPNVVYTDPEVATVGLTETRAREAGIPVSVGQFPNFANARAVTRGQENGFVKVVADARSGTVIGVQMIGPEAGELIADAVSALERECNLDEVADVVRPHPTLSESLGEACLTAAGRPLFSV